jgi:hypothetical protein
MGEMLIVCTVFVRKPEWKNHLEELGVDGNLEKRV